MISKIKKQTNIKDNKVSLLVALLAFGASAAVVTNFNLSSNKMLFAGRAKCKACSSRCLCANEHMQIVKL